MSDVLFSYGGLFVWSFLSATVVPLSSEAALALLAGTSRQVALPVLVATSGNYLGACTTYWLGRRASRALGDRGVGSAGAERAARLLARHGRPVLLLSWVPVVGDALVACAGASRMPFLGFSVWVALGKGMRYLAVAWAAAGLSA